MTTAFTNLGQFPATRLRRTRATPWIRRLTAEHVLSVDDLVLPLFVQEGAGKRTPVASLPGIDRLTIDKLIDVATEARDLGIPAIALFPATDPALKDDSGKEATNPDNLICRSLKMLKDKVPEIGIITDVALDPYTSHGHDGVLRGDDVDNDATVEVLCKQAMLLARSGADIIAPSDMMDGRILAIRECLEEAGMTNVMILSYAAKYASAFYGPFRDAVGSGSNLGKKDKRSYQMDFANCDEALREVALDIAEGADMVMIKPGMPYLDVIQRISSTYPIPVFAYQVSGEYAMIKSGAVDFEAALMESLIGFKRAGARAIFTYGALEVAKILND